MSEKMGNREEDKEYQIQRVLASWDDKTAEGVYTYEFDSKTTFGVLETGVLDYQAPDGFTAKFQFRNLPRGAYIIKLEKVR